MGGFPFAALGSLIDTGVSLWSSNKDRKFQKQQAMNQIQWRVADAKKAGIHPLAALGINPAGSIVNPPQSSLGEAGESLERALKKPEGPTIAERMMEAKQLSKMDAEINLLNAQSRSLVADALRKTMGGNSRTIGRDIDVPGAVGKFKTGTGSRQQHVEDEYGNIAGEAYGLTKLIYDLLENYAGPSVRRWKAQPTKQIPRIPDEGRPRSWPRGGNF